DVDQLVVDRDDVFAALPRTSHSVLELALLDLSSRRAGERLGRCGRVKTREPVEAVRRSLVERHRRNDPDARDPNTQLDVDVDQLRVVERSGSVEELGY